MEEEKRISEEELKKDVAAAEARIRKTDDFTSPEELYGELIASVKKYHPSDDISLIEKDPEQLKRLDSFDDYSFGGTALVGDPTDPDILKQGGVENCDAVAAVSEDDSVNLMAAQIAKSIFRREKVICRVSDPHLQVLYHKTYELETICPTVLT